MLLLLLILSLAFSCKTDKNRYIRIIVSVIGYSVIGITRHSGVLDDQEIGVRFLAGENDLSLVDSV
jgi:hypothetical protein